jgi:carbon monoxide dehydrogenase subunit G
MQIEASRGTEHHLYRDPIVLNLKGSTQVDRDPDWVFGELHDPDTLLGCVPGCSLTRRLGPRKFEARFALGAGPFKLTYVGTGRIIDSDPESRTASMTLNTQPAWNLPHVRIRMGMAVRASSRGSDLQMSFRVVLSDTTGLLTRSWVDPIACELLDRTIRQVKQRLENTPPAPRPSAA